MIKLTNLQKIYRTKEIETVALENVNLEVQQGEFLSIMGPSGCGKSTLLNIMGLLDLPTSGTVEINGVNTVGMSDKELAAFRNKHLGFVFQSSQLSVCVRTFWQRGASLALSQGLFLGAPQAGRGRAGEGRPQPPYAPFPDAALRRPVPACRHRPCHRRQSRHHPCRRTDR